MLLLVFTSSPDSKKKARKSMNFGTKSVDFGILFEFLSGRGGVSSIAGSRRFVYFSVVFCADSSPGRCHFDAKFNRKKFKIFVSFSKHFVRRISSEFRVNRGPARVVQLVGWNFYFLFNRETLKKNTIKNIVIWNLVMSLFFGVLRVFVRAFVCPRRQSFAKSCGPVFSKSVSRLLSKSVVRRFFKNSHPIFGQRRSSVCISVVPVGRKVAFHFGCEAVVLNLFCCVI